MSPLRSQIVSLSTSNDSNTATRAPPGQLGGVRSRPALTLFTAFFIRSSDHSHGGSSSWASAGCVAEANATSITIGNKIFMITVCLKLKFVFQTIVDHAECDQLSRECGGAGQAHGLQFCNHIKALSGTGDDLRQNLPGHMRDVDTVS